MDHVELAGGEEDRAQVSVPLVDHQAHHADHGGDELSVTRSYQAYGGWS